MEHIRQAIERAKETRTAGAQPQEQKVSPPQQSQFLPNTGLSGASQSWGKNFFLNGTYLESKRIIAHDIGDPRSKFFDMLRTQVLQTMDQKSWQLIGVTSPTAGCGKTVIAVNLALSIARQAERSVLLVDMDLQKPQIANQLGLGKCDYDLLSVLDEKTKLQTAIVEVHIKDYKFLVLPCQNSTPRSSEWMASRSMSTMLQEMKQNFKGWTVIFDLPPILIGDDVISILPQIDCALFVAAAGTSTVSEIKECNKHLESTPVVRMVLNKASDIPATSYY